LADRLHAALSLAALDDLADPRRALAGGRRNQANLRLQLGGDAELFQGLRQVDAAGAAARRVDIGYRFGIEQGAFERLDRADIRARRTFLHRQADGRARQHGGAAADDLGLAHELVDPRLAQNRDIDLLVRGHLLL